MTILLVMLILFRYFYNKEFILYISIGVSAVSIALSAFGLINYTVILNQYLNFFNWVGFFALGIILRKKNLLENLINWVATVVSFVGLTAFTVIAVVIGNSIEAYIDITSLFVELFGFVFFLNVSNFLANSKLLSDIGKKSFFIYLMHIQVVGAINTRLPYNALFFILRPFVGLMVCYIIAVVFKLILNKLKLNKYSFIFGLNR